VKQFRNYGGLTKIAMCGFSWRKTKKRSIDFPDFLQRCTGQEQRCATFFEESRMQFGSSNKIYRKSGFGLHQLRNCFGGQSQCRQAKPAGAVAWDDYAARVPATSFLNALKDQLGLKLVPATVPRMQETIK
jgi:hypothetical protein